MNFMRLNKEEFNDAISFFKKNEKLLTCKDDIYTIYNLVCDSIEDVFDVIIIKRFSPVNPMVLLLYIYSELNYYFENNDNSIKYIESKIKDNEFQSMIALKVADKYLTNEQLNFKSATFLNKFNPEISSMSLYLNFLLNVLDHFKDLNKYQTLLLNMLTNCFSLAKCMENLLISGFEVEAFSTWRTMHENECIIYCLLQNGKLLFDSYFRHIEYALAYRLQIKDQDEVDKIFVEIKSKMKKYDLKSKDTKKFIEYGYLFDIPEKTLNVDFKLNFRDGVQKLAGLEKYSKVYELSSEVAHSSPLLIFSSKEYYFNITMINLYESFFRLEEVFFDFYKDLANENEITAYTKMREDYIKDLKEIHSRLIVKFQQISAK